MKLILNVLLFITFILSLSCNDALRYKDVKYFSWDDFGDPVLVDMEVAELEDIPLLTRQIVIHDSLFIAYSMRTENLIYLYNLNTGKKIRECIPFGSGPGEMLNIRTLLTGDSVLVLECGQDQSVKGFLYSSLLEDEVVAEHFSYHLETPVESLTFGLNENVIGVNVALEGGRLNFYDQQGKVVHSKGNYPLFGEDMTQLETVLGFVGTVCCNVEEKRIYLFCKMTDLIEIYDFSGNLIKKLQGPDIFFPNVKQQNFEDGASTVSSRDSKDAYFQPYIVEDMIFAIYTGTEYGERETKTILVFDKEGIPLKQFKLKEDILNFAADEKNKTLYVTTMEDFEIKTFKYK